MTKQEIIDLININIASQSYTTAEEVRIVLNAMLDYIDQKAEEDNEVIREIRTNLEDNNIQLKDYGERIKVLEESSYLFQYFSDKPIRDKKDRLNCWYSFRGVLNGYVNFTLKLDAGDKAIVGQYGEYFEFDFSNDPGLITALNSIINPEDDGSPSFVVNFTNLKRPYDLKRTAAMKIGIRDTTLAFGIYPMDHMGSETPIFRALDIIYVSAIIHTNVVMK